MILPNNSDIDFELLGFGCIAGLLGGIVKTIYSTKKNQLVHILLNMLAGAILGMTVGSFMLSFGMDAYAIIASSSISGMLGEKAMDMLTLVLKSKVKQMDDIIKNPIDDGSEKLIH